MVVGEDRGKVRNIVHPHISKFRELYASALHEVEDCVSQTGDCFHQVRPVCAVCAQQHLNELLFDTRVGAIVLLCQLNPALTCLLRHAGHQP